LCTQTHGAQYVEQKFEITCLKIQLRYENEDMDSPYEVNMHYLMFTEAEVRGQYALSHVY